MISLGNYLLRSRLHAVVVTSLLTALSIFISPLAYLVSGAPVGLVSLRKGPAYGLQVVLFCSVVTYVMANLGNINPSFSLVFTTVIWVPVLICSAVLRVTQAQGFMVLSAGALGFCFILYIHAIIDQIHVWWQQMLELWKKNAASAEMAEQYQQIFDSVAPLLSVMLLSYFVLSLVTTVLFSRWWQSILFNPGGFRQEFYSLRMPKWLLFFTLGVIILMLIGPDAMRLLSRDVMIMLMLLYMFQGLAATHRFVSANKLRPMWLIALYGLLFLLPHMVLFVACIGLADACLGKSTGYIKNDGDQ